MTTRFLFALTFCTALILGACSVQDDSNLSTAPTLTHTATEDSIADQVFMDSVQQLWWDSACLHLSPDTVLKFREIYADGHSDTISLSSETQRVTWSYDLEAGTYNAQTTWWRLSPLYLILSPEPLVWPGPSGDTLFWFPPTTRSELNSGCGVLPDTVYLNFGPDSLMPLTAFTPVDSMVQSMVANLDTLHIGCNRSNAFGSHYSVHILSGPEWANETMESCEAARDCREPDSLLVNDTLGSVQILCPRIVVYDCLGSTTIYPHPLGIGGYCGGWGAYDSNYLKINWTEADKHLGETIEWVLEFTNNYGFADTLVHRMVVAE